MSSDPDWKFDVGTRLSMVGGIFAAGIWAISYWRGCVLEKRVASRSTLFLIHVACGRVEVALVDPQGPSVWRASSISNPMGISLERKPRAIGYRDELLGFGIWLPNRPTKMRAIDFSIPFWFVFGLCVLRPALRLRRQLRRHRRQSANLCIRCGYDLHATPERCPECGDMAAKSLDCGTSGSADENDDRLSPQKMLPPTSR